MDRWPSVQWVWRVTCQVKEGLVTNRQATAKEVPAQWRLLGKAARGIGRLFERVDRLLRIAHSAVPVAISSLFQISGFFFLFNKFIKLKNPAKCTTASIVRFHREESPVKVDLVALERAARGGKGRDGRCEYWEGDCHPAQVENGQYLRDQAELYWGFEFV